MSETRSSAIKIETLGRKECVTSMLQQRKAERCNG